MSKVAIVTDSTAYIPNELSQGYPVHSVPLQIIWGQEILKDGIDITPNQFFDRLVNSKTIPTTSQPSPASFKEIYEKLAAQGFDILSVHISSKLSGTMDSATQARSMLPDVKIELVDSLTTSMSLGFPVITAARAAQQGASLAECKVIAEAACASSGVLFLVNTLEFLHKGGRIGGAAAFLGTALNLKPILEVVNGKIESVDKVRTWSKAVDRLLDVFEQRVNNRTPLHIAALYGGADTEPEAQALLERAKQRFGEGQVTEAVVTSVSPVVGVHTGPGVIGLCYQVEA